MTGPSPHPCPSCGALQAADQRYCLHCGARTAAPRVDPLRDMGVHPPPRPSAPGEVAVPGNGGRRRAAGGSVGGWLRRRPVGLAAGAVAVAAGVVVGWLSGPAPGVASPAAAPHRIVLLDQPLAAATAAATPTAAPTPAPADTPAPTPAATPAPTATPTAAATVAATAAPTEAAPVAAVTATATPTPSPAPAIRHVWLVDVPDVTAGYPAELKPSGTLLSRFAPVAADPLAEDVALLSGQAQAGAAFPAQVLTLPGQLVQAGLTWQAYVADPAQGCPAALAAFHSLDGTCAPHALTDLATDAPTALDWLAVPDDATLRAVLPGVLAGPAFAAGGLVVLSAPDGALLLSPLVAKGATVAAATGPYALLRTLEDAFGLVHLGHAADPDVAALGSDVFPTPTP